VFVTVTRVAVTPGWGDVVRVVTRTVGVPVADGAPARGAWITIGTITRDWATAGPAGMAPRPRTPSTLVTTLVHLMATSPVLLIRPESTE
jgi:hypothetical protein